MSCFICKAQCWLSLLTVSHVHTADRTTAGSCAFQWLFKEYFHSDPVQQSAVEPDCGCFGQFVYFPIFLFIKSAFCALCWERTPIQSGLCNEFCCCIKNYILGRLIKNTTNMMESCLWFELWVRTVLEMNHLTV